MPSPWTEVSPVKLKEEFVLLALEPGACMAKLCRQYGVSRQNGYKWLKRYHEEGVEGLSERSRRPHGSRLQVSGEVVLVVLEMRQRRGWGPKKLREMLRRRRVLKGQPLPSMRTIARIVARGGMVTKRKRLRPRGELPSEAPAPTVHAENDLWTVDFKGWWRADNGEKCEPLTVRDAHSRYVLQAVLLQRTATVAVRPEFERLFQRYGVPRAILSDNGPPFASVTAPWGLTELSAWWVSLGIQVIHSRPGCPQDNGGHERIHLDMLPLETQSAPSRNEQQVLLDGWRREFNHVRPHEALGMKTPAQVYRPKSRHRSPAKLVSHRYPRGAAIRRVQTNGHFWWQGRALFLSRALRGHAIALIHPQPGQELGTIMFHHLALGQLNLVGGTKVQPIPDQNRQRPPAVVSAPHPTIQPRTT
jgi:transposase InsO family protein